MEYRLYQDTEWVKTNIKCPRDGQPIFRETKKSGKPTHHFCCQREGCTWPNYHERELIKQEREASLAAMTLEERIIKDRQSVIDLFGPEGGLIG